MTREAFEQINKNRIARGQAPLTFTESPTRRQLPPLDTAAARIGAPTVQELRKRGPSQLEERFLRLWTDAEGPPLEREFKFHPHRKWRADFALVSHKILFECEGGQWGSGPPCAACGQRKQGAHSRGKHFQSDADKYLAAFLSGWIVVRLTGANITAETISGILLRIAIGR